MKQDNYHANCLKGNNWTSFIE